MPKRKDGRYYKRVDIQFQGEHCYKDVYGKTQKQADTKALELMFKIKKGIDIEAQRDTWKYWSDKWLETKDQSKGQYENYVSGAKHFEELNNRKIVDIRASDIKRIINRLTKYNPNTKKPSSKRTLTFIKNVAIQIFSEAIDDRVIEFNPATSVKITAKTPPEKRRALTKVEQGWILNTPHRAQRAAIIMMYSGLRRGELIPLTWNDIDLKNKTIRVNKTVDLKSKKTKVKKEAKSSSGLRTVRIPQRLVNYLKKQKQDNVLVCPAASGKMMTAAAWRSLWKSYMKELNLKYGKVKKATKSKFAHSMPMTIPPITAHWLRHTFATLLYLSGVDVITAKEQLGHADVKTTLNIYTHLDKQFKEKNIEKLDDYLEEQIF